MQAVEHAIPQYLRLNEQIKESGQVDLQLQQQSIYVDVIKKNLKKKEETVKKISAENQIILQKIHKYKHVNVKSMVSKLKGKKEDRLAHYEEAFVTKSREEEIARRALESVQQDHDEAVRLLAKLKAKKQQQEHIQAQLNDLLNSVFHEPIREYPEEYPMAQEVKRLARERDEATKILNGYNTAYAHLQQAEQQLKRSFQMIIKAIQEHGLGMAMDIVSNYRTHARDVSKSALTHIQNALSAAPNRELDPFFEEELNSNALWLSCLDEQSADIFSGTGFSLWSVEKLKQSLRSIKQVHYEVQNAMKWIDINKKDAQRRHNQLKQQHDAKSAELLDMRRRIFEEVLQHQRGHMEHMTTTTTTISTNQLSQQHQQQLVRTRSLPPQQPLAQPPPPLPIPSRASVDATATASRSVMSPVTSATTTTTSSSSSTSRSVVKHRSAPSSNPPSSSSFQSSITSFSSSAPVPTRNSSSSLPMLRISLPQLREKRNRDLYGSDDDGNDSATSSPLFFHSSTPTAPSLLDVYDDGAVPPPEDNNRSSNNNSASNRESPLIVFPDEEATNNNNDNSNTASAADTIFFDCPFDEPYPPTSATVPQLSAGKGLEEDLFTLRPESPFRPSSAGFPTAATTTGEAEARTADSSSVAVPTGPSLYSPTTPSSSSSSTTNTITITSGYNPFLEMMMKELNLSNNLSSSNGNIDGNFSAVPLPQSSPITTPTPQHLFSPTTLTTTATPKPERTMSDYNPFARFV